MTPSQLQRANIVNPGSGRRRFAASVVMLSVVSMIAAGCSDFRRAIGESKSAPDEFEVVVRPPLSLPPSTKKKISPSAPPLKVLIEAHRSIVLTPNW